MNAVDIRTNEELMTFVATKKKVKYLFFWGHQEKSYRVTKSCFSQWYTSPFEVDSVLYYTAEHYMMAEKSRLFRDPLIEKSILSTTDPGEAKQLGRSIRNFEESLWNQKKFQIVVQGNIEKFSQNSKLESFLLHTTSRVLVEASPVDKVWGIGLAEDSPHIDNPYKWKGENLLGYALMEVRKQLQSFEG